MEKPASEYRAWYGRQIWRKRSLAQLSAEPLCRLCAKVGKLTRAEVADHVAPHKGDWNLFRLGELQSLCRNCHESLKKTVEQRGYHTTIGPDGFPTDPNHPVYGSSRNMV